MIEEKCMFKGWVQLMEAVVAFAEKDLKGKNKTYAADAAYFLNSDWCEEMVDICRMWRADNDFTNRLA